jgi:hypothetical protein
MAQVVVMEQSEVAAVTSQLELQDQGRCGEGEEMKLICLPAAAAVALAERLQDMLDTALAAKRKT